jgi:hypothetical protein
MTKFEMFQALGLIGSVHGRYCQVQTTVHAPSTDLSRIQYLNMKWKYFEFRTIRTFIYTAVFMEPSM